jgi:hypothetical protein
MHAYGKCELDHIQRQAVKIVDVAINRSRCSADLGVGKCDSWTSRRAASLGLAMQHNLLDRQLICWSRPASYRELCPGQPIYPVRERSAGWVRKPDKVDGARVDGRRRTGDADEPVRKQTHF